MTNSAYPFSAVDPELFLKEGIEAEVVEANSELGLDFHRFFKVTPHHRTQLSTLLNLAQQYNFALYPYSRGRNFGYGANFPLSPDQVVVDLSHFNHISDYNPELGEVRIDAGVTQSQLFEFLKDKPFLMDATGAGPEASIVGNALDGGFGYSPYGIRRYSISDLEVFLPQGGVLRTGHPLSKGPGLTQLFIQGNYGLVVSAKLKLYPKPDKIFALLIQIQDQSNLGLVLKQLKWLKAEGTIKNILHFANPLRSFMSSASLEDPSYQHLLALDLVTEADIFQATAQFPPLAYWTGLGALMGDKDSIKVYSKRVKKAIAPYARVTLLDLPRVKLIETFIAPFVPSLRKKLGPLKDFIRLQEGYPTDLPWQNIRWRYGSIEETGLIWIGVLIPNQITVINDFYTALLPLFTQEGFECPVTISLVEPQSLIAVISIVFERLNPEAQTKAQSLYRKVLLLVEQQGLELYRQGILPGLVPTDLTKLAFCQQLKQAIDPQGIIAPGKYGI